MSRSVGRCASAAAALCVAATAACADGAQADAESLAPRKPLWELGLGVAVLHAPDYRGADASRSWLLPLPYVVYRGRYLRADREGARAMLVDTERVKLDVSLYGALPTRRDSAARSGMPALAPVVEIGPAATLGLWRAADARSRVDLRLPLRSAIAVERHPHAIGATFVPQLQWSRNGVAGGWDVGVQTGPVYGSRRYHATYYGVDPAYATAQRPAYAAPGGYGGWHTMLTASRRYERTWVGAFVRHDSLRGAAFAASPLVRSNQAWMAGIGIAWVLGTSDETVPARD